MVKQQVYPPLHKEGKGESKQARIGTPGTGTRQLPTSYQLSPLDTQYSPFSPPPTRKFTTNARMRSPALNRKISAAYPITGTKKYYKYQKDGGHDTHFCIALKDMIQSLINDDKFNQYKPCQEVHNVNQV